MIRWTVAVILLLAALISAGLGYSRLTPRGVNLSVYDNLRWSGDPTIERTMRHVEFGPGLRHNRLQLPDKSSAHLDGWLYAPRAGLYVFETESDSDVWVRVGRQPVVTHKGRRSASRGSVRLAKGFYPLRIRIRHRKGRSFLAFNWQMPSGYMDMETFPPVFVQPEEPTVGPTVPVALRLGPLLLLLLAFAFAFGPAVARWTRRLGTDSGFRMRVAAGVLIFCATLSYRGWDLNGTGETSDEWAYSIAGRIYVSNIVHGYHHSRYWHSNEEHPPIGKYIYGLTSHLCATDEYSVLRFASAVMNALTVLIVFLFALRFLNLWTGVFAGGVLALLPHFVAHGKVAALDSPACLFFTWAVYLSVCAVVAKEGRNWRFLLAGLVASLAFAVKFSNVLVLVFVFLVHFVSQWSNIRKKGLLEMPVGLYVVPLLPMLVLFAVWPWLWKSPFGQLVDTLKHWDYPIQEWFLGNYTTPPWFYFPICFLATTPSLLLIPVGAFLVGAWRRRWFIDAVLVLWFITPFAWSISALKQDGIRYIYTMYPPLALMIGSGLCILARTAARRWFAAAVVAIYLGWSSWLIHPYYLNYYSEVVGGPSTVYRLSWFEIGWWGEGMDKAYKYINETAPHGASFDLSAVVTHTSDQLRPDIRLDTSNPDFFIKAYVTPGQEEKAGYAEVMRVEIEGAPLVIVYERVPELEDAEK